MATAERGVIESGQTSRHSDVPHQPRNFRFPARSFGSKGEKRPFKAAWFDTWPWLDYREISDSVLCHYCSRANDRKLLARGLYGKREETFATKGFVNWKDACTSLEGTRPLNIT